MRISLIVGAILLMSIPALSGQQAHAAKPAPTRPAPVKAPLMPKAPNFVLPTGATVDTELNMSESDLLGMIKQALPSFTRGFADAGGELGNMIKMLDLDALASCVQEIKALRLVQFKLKEGSEPKTMLPYFESQVPSSKGWDRVFYSSTAVKDGVVAIYTLKGKSYLGVMLDSANTKNYVLGTQGFVDIPKVTMWAGKALKLFTSMGEDDDDEAATPVPPVQPVPPAPPAPAP